MIMGQFSWLDCKTKEQILDNVSRDVYLLIPKEFGGGHVVEHCYDGYGHFGRHDVYDLVADWNRSWVAAHPDYIRPYDAIYAEKHPEHPAKKMCEMPWWPFYSDLTLSREEVVKKWKEAGAEGCLFGCEYRIIGIDLACYDDDNNALPYPIKITHDPDAVYERCDMSWSDPDQGWLMEESEEEYD